MQAKPYHHGALRPVLLDAAELILERDGLNHVSLRALARAAEVSHAAPAHHFGDLRGLLTALATIGFQRFTASLEDAAMSPKDPLPALGRSYVQFARAHPALFQLMFHHRVLDSSNADFQAATVEAFATLARVTSASSPEPESTAVRARALSAWCLVHGFSMLLLDGRLPSQPSPDELLENILAGD